MEEKHIYEKCLRCNRKLQNDLAKERGYGPHCWNIHIVEIKSKQKTLFDIADDIRSKLKKKENNNDRNQ